VLADWQIAPHEISALLVCHFVTSGLKPLSGQLTQQLAASRFALHGHVAGHLHGT
jgi:hypothetical protein